MDPIEPETPSLNYARSGGRRRPSSTFWMAFWNILAASAGTPLILLVKQIHNAKDDRHPHFAGFVFGTAYFFLTAILANVYVAWLAGGGRSETICVRFLVFLPLVVPIGVLIALLWAIASS